jgi:hypothetical protein
MTSIRGGATAALAVALAALGATGSSSAASGSTPPRATLATFTQPRYWGGHDRGLEITRRGYALEGINDGCCKTIIDVSYKLLFVSGTTSNATATFRVLKVRLYEKSKAGWVLHVPRVGQRGQLRLAHGVVTDSITGYNFCGRGAPIGVCGA